MHGLRRIPGLVLSALTLLLLPLAAGAAQDATDATNLVPGTQIPDQTGSFDDPSSFDDTQYAVFSFPSSGSAIVGSVGFIDAEQVGYFWSVLRGDSVTEAFSGPATISSYALHVDVPFTVLAAGAFVNWDVIINGVTVDNFTVNDGFIGTVNRAASFPPISGPDYTVELRVTNEVASGDGSHTFRYAGAGNHVIALVPATAQAIPTTSQLGLILLALLLFTFGFWLLRRRVAV